MDFELFFFGKVEQICLFCHFKSLLVRDSRKKDEPHLTNGAKTFIRSMMSLWSSNENSGLVLCVFLWEFEWFHNQWGRRVCVNTENNAVSQFQHENLKTFSSGDNQLCDKVGQKNNNNSSHQKRL